MITVKVNVQGHFYIVNLQIYWWFTCANPIFDIFFGSWDIFEKNDKPCFFPKIEPKHAFSDILNKPPSQFR